MENLSKRLKFVMDQRGFTQQKLAEVVKISQQSIGKIISGLTLNPKNIVEIANALGVDVNWLKTGEGPAPDFANLPENPTACDDEDDEVIRLEVLDIYASAGNGRFVTGDLTEFTHAIEFDSGYFMQMFQRSHTNGLAIINIEGDSMEPTINSGDLLFVNTQKQQYTGDGIYVFSYDDTLYVKRLQLAGDKLLVISDNRFYEIWEISRENEGRFTIHGKVEFSQMKVKKLG